MGWRNKNCPVSKGSILKYANTGKKMFPYRNTKIINPILITTKMINI